MRIRELEAEYNRRCGRRKLKRPLGRGRRKEKKFEETMVDQDDTLEPAEKKGKFDWDEIITQY